MINTTSLGTTKRKREPKIYDNSWWLEPEHKYKDTSITGDVDATPNYLESLLNGLDDDATVSGRIGRQILIKWMSVRGYFRWTGSATDNLASANIRWTLYRDKMNNAENNTAAQHIPLLLQSGVTLPGSGRQVLTHFNRENVKRFAIIIDQMVGMTGSTGTLGIKMINWNKEEDVYVTYGGNDATAASIQNNALYLLVQCDGAATTHKINVQLETRIVYVDY